MVNCLGCCCITAVFWNSTSSILLRCSELRGKQIYYYEEVDLGKVVNMYQC